MSFRREYNKINRGLRCRCSIGESLGGCVFCFVVAPPAEGGGGVRGEWMWGLGAIALFGGLGDLFIEIRPAAVCKKKKERKKKCRCEHTGRGGEFSPPFLPGNLTRIPTLPLPPKDKPSKTHTPIKTNPPPPPLFLQMVSPPRHQKNDGRTLPSFWPVHLARRTHRFLRLV